MRIKEVKIYKFDELSEDSKEKAIEKLSDINVDYDWWDFVYNDAENVGIKITSFDIDRRSYCNGDFILDHTEIAHKIMENHGETCETYKTAEAFLKDRDQIVENAPRDENGDFENEYELDKKLDDIESEFEKSILEDYRIMLQKEHEYKTSRESIIETIRANDYEFDENGNLE